MRSRMARKYQIATEVTKKNPKLVAVDEFSLCTHSMCHFEAKPSNLGLTRQILRSRSG